MNSLSTRAATRASRLNRVRNSSLSRERGMHHLERPTPIGLEMHHLVDGAHAAGRDAADEAVAAREDLPFGKCG